MRLEELTGKHVVHIPTQKQWNKLCVLLNEIGLKWCNREKYIQENWNSYKELTCLRVKKGDYADLDYFKRNDFIIFDVNIFLNENKTYELWI